MVAPASGSYGYWGKVNDIKRIEKGEIHDTGDGNCPCQPHWLRSKAPP